METPNIPTSKSQSTVNLTQSSSVSTKGYIFEPIDEEHDKIINIKFRVEPLKDLNDAFIEGLSAWEAGYEIMLVYNFYENNGTKAHFIGRRIIDGIAHYCRIEKALSGPNPNGVGEIKLCDENGNLLNNLILESTRDDIVICTNSKGQVTALDDNHIEGCQNFDLVAKEVTKLKITCGDDPIICNITTDTYITGDSIRGANPDVTLILDGGNLYRYHKLVGVPARVICKNGTFIDIKSKCQKLHPETLNLASHTHIIKANEHCCFELTTGQNNIVVEFNPMDFVKAIDYAGKNSAAAINLNNVLERIFGSIYNSNDQGQRMLIKMPETHYGGTNFYMDRPLHIPHNVTIDMSGAFIFVADTFQTNDSGCIFSFDTNKVNVISATSIIKNFTMRFDPQILSNKKKPANLRCVFDLTHFQGTLEGIKIYMNFNTEIVAFWQPFGTPTETYSDRKIIRRCSVGEFGWRNETPVAIFCEGDGCIIEQCILGYVAIICGSSYTIKGCLNDKYFLYDTSVDFSGSYWEVGQFEILNSKVTFSNCKLHASNNNFTFSHPTYLQYYLGPWMAIDTEGCRKRLINLFKKHELNLDRFNQIKEDFTYGGLYRGCAVSENSTVKFDSTVTSTQTYWGYKQPMSGPLFKIGAGAKIIGIENLESLKRIYIHNSFEIKKNENGEIINTAPDKISVNVTQAAKLPLVNGDFADVKSDIIVPTNLTFNVGSAGFYEDEEKTQNSYKGKEHLMGFDWGGEKFTNIRARFVLDRQRKLYSSEFKTSDKITAVFGEYARILINCDMSEQTYKNLKLELLFSFGKGLSADTYIMRQHFNRTVNGNLFSFGKNNNGEDVNNILPSYSTNITIGEFAIVKACCNLAELEAQKMPNSEVQPVEHIEIDDDMPKPTNKALCDYCGNMYEPVKQLLTERVNVATRIQWIGENNVRAFMTSLPQYGTWNDGDEVVLLTAVYRYFGGKWYQYISFRESAMLPVDLDDSGITTDPIKPIIP